MLSLYLIVSVIITIICMETLSQEMVPLKSLLKDNPRSTFDKLLYNLARVNEDRLKSLKRDTYLQELVIINGNFDDGRTDHNSFLDEDRYANLPLFLNNKRSQSGSSRQPKALDQDTELKVDLDEMSPIAAVLRSNWRTPCEKSAMKHCTKACRSAVRNVCSVYKCSSRSKRRFKTECKRSCKSTFTTGRYSDSYDDSDYSD